MNEGQNEGINKRFCSNCGKQIPLTAKFCIYCGQKIEGWEDNSQKASKIPEQKKVVKRESDVEDMSFVAYQTLEPGEVFFDYKIIQLQGKDTDGVRYLVEKDGKRYVLKMLFQYKYSNLENIITMQNWIERIQKLQHPNVVEIEEINYNSDPVYMVTELVEGMSLAKIKTSNTSLLTESLVRDIAKQLVSAAIEIHKLGLSIKNLSLNDIMLDPEELKLSF